MDAIVQASIASATFFVFAGLLFTGLELLRPIVASPNLWPRVVRSAQTDVLHFVVNPILAYPAAVGALSFIASIVDRVTPAMTADLIDAVPLLLRVALAVLCADLLGYGAHRLFHAWPVLYRFHALHHSSPTLDWLATGRHHPVDQLALMIAASLPLIVLRISPASITALLVLFRLHSVLVHANVALPASPLRHLLAGPRYHRVHHAQDGPAANFATLFPFVDRLFGTYREPTHDARFGTDHPIAENYMDQILTTPPSTELPSPRRFFLRCLVSGLVAGAVTGTAWAYGMSGGGRGRGRRVNHFSPVVNGLPTSSHD